MRYLKRGFTGIATVVVFAVVGTLVPAAASVGPAVGAGSQSSVSASQTDGSRQGTLTSTVRGTFGGAGHVTGKFVPHRFVVDNGKVYGIGKLTAKLTRGNGTVVGEVRKTVAIPVRSANYGHGFIPMASCKILNLVLGHLHINLLGLHVDLKKVVLHIVAKSGAGRLLGNLLCAIAHLLDGTHLNRLANTLNRILGLLGL
jgi:hypothetical protein